MTMNDDLVVDVEQMYRSGIDVRRIAELLECDLITVYRALELLGLSNVEKEDPFDPWNTINS